MVKSFMQMQQKKERKLIHHNDFSANLEHNRESQVGMVIVITYKRY